MRGQHARPLTSDRPFWLEFWLHFATPIPDVALEAAPPAEPVHVRFDQGHAVAPIAQEHLGEEEILHIKVALPVDQPVRYVGYASSLSRHWTGLG